MEYIVTENCELLEFLYSKMKDLSKKRVKGYLVNRHVIVDNKIITKYDYQLRKNQKVSIDKSGGIAFLKRNKIELLYEDKELIIINKPSGLLSIATTEEKTVTAYNIMTNYVKLSNPKSRIFIVHRLDRDTSGIIMFAKDENLKHKLQDNWDKIVIFRGYVAVVEGILKVKEDTIKNNLIEDKNFTVHSTNSNSGELAITKYSVVKEKNNLSLVKLELKTGRKNQIRVHMQELGHPIIGDKKYGSKKNLIKRLGLHAYKLAFIHPVTNKKMEFETDIPKEFIYIIS
jgi:pseudouridine synthase, RluA family